MPVVDACPEDPIPELITEEHAVFARADAPDGPGEGTRDKPFVSLQAAIDAAAAANKRVYACAGAVFQEVVVIDAPIEVRGGFDCEQGWTYDPQARSSLLGAPEVVAMTLTLDAGGASVVGWHVEAPDAVTPGAGATAVAVDLVEAPTSFCRCDLVAGDGASGVDGQTWAGTPPAPDGGDAPWPGEPGGATDACVAPALVQAGLPGMTACEIGLSKGGMGGTAGLPPAGMGGNGESTPPIQGNPGKGGIGGTVANTCMPGSEGFFVMPGVNGAGGKGLPDFSLTGVKTHDGQPGQNGHNGQGGGGGGGAAYSLFCGGVGLPPGPGASGGGGGAGGCGGKAGGAGTAGGSSIGLLSMGGEIYLQTVTITAGNGGHGGNGGEGQLPGQGGQGAPGGQKAQGSPGALGCAGAAGVAGTKGGWGGGGQGGDSVAIAFSEVDGVVVGSEDSTYSVGVPGIGGNDSNGSPVESKGHDGHAEVMRTYVLAP